MPTVLRTPRGPTVTCAPRAPNERLGRERLRLSRRPGASVTRRKKRTPMRSPRPCAHASDFERGDEDRAPADHRADDPAQLMVERPVDAAVDHVPEPVESRPELRVDR